MFDRFSFAIFVRYGFDNYEAENVYGVYDSEARAEENMQHCHNYAAACEKDGSAPPRYRLARVRLMELDEEPTAYEPADANLCVCGHSKDEHASSAHPSGQSPCVAEPGDVFGHYADDCMKFRPAYNEHPAMS